MVRGMIAGAAIVVVWVDLADRSFSKGRAGGGSSVGFVDRAITGR
jgi:hypothetical protein